MLMVWGGMRSGKLVLTPPSPGVVPVAVTRLVVGGVWCQRVASCSLLLFVFTHRFYSQAYTDIHGKSMIQQL